jgi:hypothetical protein
MFPSKDLPTSHYDCEQGSALVEHGILNLTDLSMDLPVSQHWNRGVKATNKDSLKQKSWFEQLHLKHCSNGRN